MLREELINARPHASLYADSLRQLPDDIRGLQGRVAGLAMFPIKALGALKIESARLSRDGLQTVDEKLIDRMAMIAVKKSGVVDGEAYEYERLSQRECGMLARISPEYDYKKELLRYRTVDAEPLEISVRDLMPREGDKVSVKITGEGDIKSGVLENGKMTAWIRSYIARHASKLDPQNVEVIVRSQNFSRSVAERLTGGHSAQTLFSDGGQLLIDSASTLAWMNNHLRQQYGEAHREIALNALRANITLDGLPPNIEDIIGAVRIILSDSMGSVAIKFGDPCIRCDVTRVDVPTGQKPDKEPLKWLAKERPPRLDKQNSVTFGINAAVDPSKAGGVIRVNNMVTVAAEKNHRT